MEKDNSLTMLVTGIGVGAIAAMLLTRRSGEELRREIRRQAKALAARAEAAAVAGHETVGSHLVQTKGAVRASGVKAVDAINSAVDRAARVADDLLDQTGELARRAGKIAEPEPQA